MKEASWFKCIDPDAMMTFVRRRASHRKLRLFACACCRRLRNALRGKKGYRVLEANENFADSKISRKDMEEVRKTWYTFDYPFPTSATWQMALAQATMIWPSARLYWRCANLTAIHARLACTRPERERLKQVALLRDIFGNPFQSVTVDSAWLAWNDGTVVKLAHALYDERAFDLLPILADALEEAGCDNADILNHCRQPGEHVRGCWVVDLLLNKS